MINPIKASEIKGYEELTFVEKDEVIDAMYGINAIKLTDKEINALKEGKCIYTEDGEYANIIIYDNK